MQVNARRQHFVELASMSLERTLPTAGRGGTAEAARSKDNISRWLSYLPADCVRTMIRMGWDVTT
jgi:hypothetical protein